MFVCLFVCLFVWMPIFSCFDAVLDLTFGDFLDRTHFQSVSVQGRGLDNSYMFVCLFVCLFVCCNWLCLYLSEGEAWIIG